MSVHGHDDKGDLIVLENVTGGSDEVGRDKVPKPQLYPLCSMGPWNIYLQDLPYV